MNCLFFIKNSKLTINANILNHLPRINIFNYLKNQIKVIENKKVIYIIIQCELKNVLYRMKFKNYLFLFVFIFLSNAAKAEIIENQKIISKEFGSWVVSCREDAMLAKSNCKFFTEIVEGTTLFINPSNLDNKIILISKEILEGSKVVFRIDRNNLINSRIVRKNTYNLIDIDVDSKKEIFEQLRLGKTLYIRFSVKDSSSNTGSKQITARLDLADFVKALSYYNTMTSNSL